MGIPYMSHTIPRCGWLKLAMRTRLSILPVRMDQSHVGLQRLGRLQLPAAHYAHHTRTTTLDKAIVGHVCLVIPLRHPPTTFAASNILASSAQRIHLPISMHLIDMRGQQAGRPKPPATLLTNKRLRLVVQPGHVTLHLERGREPFFTDRTLVRTILGRCVVLYVVIESGLVGKRLSAHVAHVVTVLGCGVDLFLVVVQTPLRGISLTTVGTLERVLIQVHSHVIECDDTTDLLPVTTEDVATRVIVGRLKVQEQLL